jgi:hypothetical protein
MSAFYKVMRLSTYFLYEVERAAPVVVKIVNATRRWCRPVMAGKRSIEFIILTEENSQQLVERLRPTLDSITTISDYKCGVIQNDVIGKEPVDVLATYVAEAWQELRKRNHPDYVRQGERGEPVVVGNMENFDRRTAIEMGIKARRSGKPPKDSDHP